VSIADISDEGLASWSASSDVFATRLPAVNRLVRENFDLKAVPDAITTRPQLVHDTEHVKVWQFASKNFANQPKGMLVVNINNPHTITDIDNTILLSIWRDLYSKSVVALNTEASVAGMSMQLSKSNGIVFTVGGFTDKQSELISAGMNELKIAPTELEFKQAIDRYVRAIANKGKDFPYSQAFSAYNKATTQGSFEDDALMRRAAELKLNDLTRVIDDVLNNNQVRVFMFGNYDKNDVSTVVSNLENVLPKDAKTTPYTRSNTWLPQAGEVLSVQRDIDVADVAVVDLHIHPLKGVKQEAQGMVLQGHFRNAVFDKLRTEEQLAYAVGGFSTSLDGYAGLGLYIQTPVKGPGDMQARFDKYKVEYQKELAALTPDTFLQLKNAVLVRLNEQPKNLSQEVQPFLSDWYDEKFDFDSRAALIAEVEKVTLNDIKDFYNQTILNKRAARINVQMRGTKFADTPFAELDNEKLIKDFSEASKVISYQK
jgi:protease-3